MNTTAIFSLWCVIAVLLVTGCASSSPNFNRPAYVGVDSVDLVTESQLLGTWTVHPLNPHPSAQLTQTTIEYRADGTVLGVTSLPTDTSPELVSIQITGQWELKGGTVHHQNMTVRSLDDHEYSLQLSELLNSSSQEIGGTANIHELNANRMIMLGNDGVAMEYLRQSLDVPDNSGT